MPTFILQTYDAKPSYGGFSIALNLGGGGYPHQTFTAKTTTEALARLAQHCEQLALAGKPLAGSVQLAEGERAPSGWRALRYRDTTIPVNLHAKAEA